MGNLDHLNAKSRGFIDRSVDKSLELLARSLNLGSFDVGINGRPEKAESTIFLAPTQYPQQPKHELIMVSRSQRFFNIETKIHNPPL